MITIRYCAFVGAFALTTHLVKGDEYLWWSSLNGNGPSAVTGYPQTTAGGPPSVTTYVNRVYGTKNCAPCTQYNGHWYSDAYLDYGYPLYWDCVAGTVIGEATQTGTQNNNWGSATIKATGQYGFKADGTCDVSVLKSGLMDLLGLGSGNINVSVGNQGSVTFGGSVTVTWSWQSLIQWDPVSLTPPTYQYVY
jgi:hypothetical protein